jgi:hypothetical protein
MDEINTVPLSSKEIRILENRLSYNSIGVTFIALILFGILIFLGVLLKNQKYALMITILIGISFITAMVLLIQFFFIRKLEIVNYDLKKKLKKIIKGKILTKQYADESGNLYLILKSGSYKVKKEWFDKFNQGDIIEIHSADFSGWIFDIKKVYAKQSSINPPTIV